LVNHSEIVLVDPLKQVAKIIQKQQLVVLSKRIEESGVPFIRSNEDSRVRNQDVLRILIDCFSRYYRLLGQKPKVTSSNMEGIEDSFRIAILDRLLSNSLDNTSSCTLDLIRLPQMIPDKSLRPQILMIVVKEQECVKVDQ